VENGIGISARRNPVVFAVGCPRSGTTLLTRMLNAHPLLAMTPETHWIPKFYPGGEGDRMSAALTERLAGYHRICKLGITPEELQHLLHLPGETSYADFVCRFFDLYAGKVGKPLAGDKTPSYVRVIPFLHRLFPQARFVHLVRDGRDVALSALSWNKNHKNVGRFSCWTAEPLITSALWWAWNVTQGRQASDLLGAGGYLELRYEALVADPEGVGRQLCEFLQLPYDQAMAHFYEGHTRDVGKSSAKKAWLPPTHGLRDWRRQMSAEQLELFEAAAGGVLTACAYERRFPLVSSAVQERVASVHRVFEAETQMLDQRPAR